MSNTAEEPPKQQQQEEEEEVNTEPEEMPSPTAEPPSSAPTPPSCTSSAPAPTPTSEDPAAADDGDDDKQEPVDENSSGTAIKEEPPTAPSTPLAEETNNTPSVIVTRSGRKRPPFKYNPDKVTLRFLFANKDGLAVTIECNPSDTVGEVKGALLSVWPEDLPDCKGDGDRLRLICMGKGILTPDTRTLDDLQVPVFKTHPTPVNVSVRPDLKGMLSEKQHASTARRPNRTSAGVENNTIDQGCSCVIL